MLKALRTQDVPLALALGSIAGAALFYGLPVDPPWGIGLTVSGLMLVLLGLINIRAICLSLWVIYAIGVYFSLAQVEMAHPDFPWQEAAAQPVWATGEISSLEQLPGNRDQQSLVFQRVKLYGLSTGPYRAQELNIDVDTNQIKELRSGQAIALTMSVLPPESPGYPGERDTRIFRERLPLKLYGYIRNDIEPTWLYPEVRHTNKIIQWDMEFKNRLLATSRSYGNGVISTLISGSENQIPENTKNAYRTAGLSYILGISALELALIGTGIFGLMLWILSMSPGMVLGKNGKAISAIAGFIGATAYAVWSGADFGVEETLVVVGILMLTINVGQIRSLLQLWTMAVLVIVACQPIIVMSAGFQLCFATGLALILLKKTYPTPHTWAQTGILCVRGCVVIAWVCVPIILIHYSQLQTFVLMANIAVVPLMIPVIYLTITGLILWPVGLAAYPWQIAGLMQDTINALVIKLPVLQDWNVSIPSIWWPIPIVLGLLVLIGIYTRQRHATLLGIVLLFVGEIASATYFNSSEPELDILQEGNAATMVINNTSYTLWGEGEYKLVEWVNKKRLGEGGAVQPNCKVNGCTWSTPLGIISRLNNIPSIEDCHRSRLILSPEKGSECPQKTLQTDHFGWAVLQSGNLTVNQPSCARAWEKTAPICWNEEETEPGHK